MLDKIKNYAVMTLAGVAGILILALKLQGTRLHKARVDLLRKSIELDTTKDDIAIAAKKSAYKLAKKEYTLNK